MFLLALASTGRFKKNVHCFLIKGHSFKTCDQDFATEKSKIRKEDMIYTHKEYITLIEKSSSYL
jgi:hypothetical protein